MKIVILMAGIGSRLGNPFPKCLTPLRDGYTILDHQLENLSDFTGDIIGVVGFKKEMIMEAHPELLFCYNPRYDQTNTSQSLRSALVHVQDEDVLFLNGDVVFDRRILPALLESQDSCMAVVTARVGEEEVKFSLGANGCINAVSKTVAEPLGEAIGINLVRAKDIPQFKECLARCADDDYFERAFEACVNQGLVLRAVDVSAFPCIEIDFVDDLDRAKEILLPIKDTARQSDAR